MDFEDLMPCGNCDVCEEYLDHSDAGFCEHCGGGFHWSRCGGWENGKYTCNNCSNEEEKTMDRLTWTGDRAVWNITILNKVCPFLYPVKVTKLYPCRHELNHKKECCFTWCPLRGENKENRDG